MRALPRIALAFTLLLIACPKRITVNGQEMSVDAAQAEASGKLKAWGEAVLQGVALALEGSGFRVAAKDTRGEPDGAQAALEELAGEGVIAVLGGVTNAEAPRSATAAQEAGLPFVSLAKVDGVTEAGPFVFRSMLTPPAQAKGPAE